MAVQKSKRSRSSRGMRRGGKSVQLVGLGVDKYSGEKHQMHNMTATGYYRGRKVYEVKKREKKNPNQ